MNPPSWFFKGLVALFALLLASCAKEESAAPQPIEPENSSPHFVTYEKALEGMNELIQFIDGQDASRAAQPRRVIADHYVHSFGERSRAAEGSDVNTDIYVVNFEDEQGFAILASDERLPGVFALAESGSLDLSQPIENPGLEIFVNNLGVMMAAGIMPIESADPDPNDPDAVIGYQPWTNFNIRGPFISVQWDQGPPYNKYSQMNAGCVPIAVAQIMAYHEFPTSHNGYTFDWSEMKKHTNSLTNSYPSAHELIAVFIQQISSHNNLRATGIYGAVSVDRVYATFFRLGYSLRPVSQTNSWGFVSYSNEQVLTSLSESNPIYARGDSQGGTGGGHAWVIDGCLTQQRIKHRYSIRVEPHFPDEYTIEYRELVHCNWGWAGAGNGFYFSGVFDPINGPKEVNENLGESWSVGANRTFTDIQLLPIIKR